MRVDWSAQAREDLDRAWHYYAERSAHYANHVEARILARAATLASLPYIGRLNRQAAVRELSVPDIQYVIAYAVDDPIIRIVRIWHTKQNREGQ